MSVSQIVIIGGGQAGAQAAVSLRLGGYEGAIALVSEEAEIPYQRPPLSKAYMKGEMAKERLLLKPRDWYADNNIELHLGAVVERLDRTSAHVVLSDGRSLSYDRLIIATGARPRYLPIPGADAEGVFALRTLEDVSHIQPYMKPGAKLVIIGAGYIGLEAAAVARELGLEVTVLEVASRILSRVTSETMSQFYMDVHRRHGVDLRTDAGATHIETQHDKVSGIALQNGETLPADIVLVGIGVSPNVEFAERCGIDVQDGIIVDDHACTSDPTIFAIGDCANRPLSAYGRRGRLESVHNAIEQGKIAAATILDEPLPKLDCPWFWSDQYDLKLQIAGLSQGHDHHIIRGNPDEQSFAVFYFKDQRLIAVDAVNRPQEFLVGKKLILSGAVLQHLPFADETVTPKQLADLAKD